MLDMEHLDEFEAFVRERFSKLDSVQLNSLNWYPAWYYDNCEVDGAFDDVSDLVGATIYFGCTKVVFLFSEYPQYVVKVPFVGVQYWETEDDCDEPSYVESEALFRNQEDYCAIEEEVYSAARFDEVEDIFAETSFLGQLGEVKMYVAECAGVSFFGFSDSDILTTLGIRAQKSERRKVLVNGTATALSLNISPLLLNNMVRSMRKSLLLSVKMKAFKICTMAL